MRIRPSGLREPAPVNTLDRRRAGLATLGLLALPMAHAQKPAIQRLGVFALLGDSIQVIEPDQATGSRIKRDERMELTVRDIGFDNIALRAVREAAERLLPAAQLSMYRSTRELAPGDQRAVAEGAARAELPDWIVRAIGADRLSHVLLITRHRGEAVLDTSLGGAGGRGRIVEGIGFYIDTVMGIRNADTKVESDGMLGAYAQVRLTLMDAMSGDLLRQVDLREGRAIAPQTYSGSAHPWNFIDSRAKAEVLRNIVERGMREKAADVLNTA